MEETNIESKTYVLWFNLILGSNFIFLCFKLAIIHYHTQKQRKIKFEPRIKLSHTYASTFVNAYILFSFTRVQCSFTDGLRFDKRNRRGSNICRTRICLVMRLTLSMRELQTYRFSLRFSKVF